MHHYVLLTSQEMIISKYERKTNGNYQNRCKGRQKSQTNQLTIALAITEEAERLKNIQNRIGTKRRIKSKLTTDH